MVRNVELGITGLALPALACGRKADDIKCVRARGCQALDGDSAHSTALRLNQPIVVDCLGATAGWAAFKIAAGCRLHADARRMLHHGTIKHAEDCSQARSRSGAGWFGAAGLGPYIARLSKHHVGRGQVAMHHVL